MRHGWAAVATLLLVTACGSGASGGAAASCVGPQLVALIPDHGPAGASVTLTVEWLRNGCNDTGRANEETPRTNVPVHFGRQPDQKLVGAVSGAGAHYRGTLRFAVPSTARPGPAVVLLGPERQHIATFDVVPS